MAFDWISFLERYGISHVTSGHNVRRGNVGVPCPFCGDDPSFHMGISLTGRGWHCWRNDNHSGRAPQPLIVALLGCGYAEANTIVGANSVGFATTENSFSDDINRHLGIRPTEGKPSGRVAGSLEFLPEFRPLNASGFWRRLVLRNLREERLYGAEDVETLTSVYGLQFAPIGKFAYRIIFPVTMNKKLVNWTGRTIAADQGLRYRSLTTDFDRAQKDGLPAAPMNIKHTLWNYDEINAGDDTLVVAEGPFDALRIDYLGWMHGIRGTCLFSQTPTPEQIDLLCSVGKKYRKRYLLLDRNTDLHVFKSFPEYAHFEPLSLPSHLKDPAVMSHKDFQKVLGISASRNIT